MIAKEKTLPVSLTLEESGTLCHCLMRSVMDMHNGDVSRVERFFMNPPDAYSRRVVLLYNKLSDTNDKLMGKK